jgi:hypothetical protein
MFRIRIFLTKYQLNKAPGVITDDSAGSIVFIPAKPLADVINVKLIRSDFISSTHNGRMYRGAMLEKIPHLIRGELSVNINSGLIQ